MLPEFVERDPQRALQDRAQHHADLRRGQRQLRTRSSPTSSTRSTRPCPCRCWTTRTRNLLLAPLSAPTADASTTTSTAKLDAMLASEPACPGDGNKDGFVDARGPGRTGAASPTTGACRASTTSRDTATARPMTRDGAGHPAEPGHDLRQEPMASTSPLRAAGCWRGGAALAAAAAGFVGWRAWSCASARRARAGGALGDGVTAQGHGLDPGRRVPHGQRPPARAASTSGPAHQVRVQGFWMDVTHVTNDAVRRLRAGRPATSPPPRSKPDWETHPRAVAARHAAAAGSARWCRAPWCSSARGAPVRLDDYSQWWRYVPGADWRHPQGPGSSIDGKGEHPVVQVSLRGRAGLRAAGPASACRPRPSGSSPRAAAWSRPPMPGATTSRPKGEAWPTIWDAQQRAVPGGEPEGRRRGRHHRRCGPFPANGYGLYDMTGNAWQWVADWYRADYFAQQAEAGARPIDDPQGPPTASIPRTRACRATRPSG